MMTHLCQFGRKKGIGIFFDYLSSILKQDAMKKSMLEYSKIILEKVSFDAQLFEKELKKAFGWLLEKERKELEEWVNLQFSRKLVPVIVRKQIQ
jgi:predicted metal-binding protein